jgi:hypothetical protein
MTDFRASVSDAASAYGGWRGYPAPFTLRVLRGDLPGTFGRDDVGGYYVLRDAARRPPWLFDIEKRMRNDYHMLFLHI